MFTINIYVYVYLYIASNVLLKMQCSCSKPLMCACPHMSVFLHFVSVHCYEFESNDIQAANDSVSNTITFEKKFPLMHFDGFEKDLEYISGKKFS